MWTATKDQSSTIKCLEWIASTIRTKTVEGWSAKINQWNDLKKVRFVELDGREK